jgi:hypothetical protein
VEGVPMAGIDSMRIFGTNGTTDEERDQQAPGGEIDQVVVSPLKPAHGRDSTET